MPRQIVVDIVGDATKFNSAAQGAVDKTSRLGGKLSTVGKGIAVGAGVAAFNLIGSAVDLAVGSLGTMDQAFKDDQLSQVKLRQALKNNIPSWNGNSDAIEKYADKQAALGFTDDEVRDSIGQLIGVTHDQEEAMKLNSLAQDLARAKGLDLATATDIVTKAHEGTGRALKGLGIDIDGAKTGAELLDAAQKNVKGSAEAWADTAEGRQTAAQVKVSEAMEKIGGVVDKVSAVVLPALADAFVVVADAVATASDTIGDIMSHLQGVFQVAGAIIGLVFSGVSVVVQGAQQFIVAQIRIIMGVIQGLIGFVQTAIGVVSTLIGKNDALRKQEADRKTSATHGFFDSLPFFGGGRAFGGDVDAGFSYVVGERGPEIFKPKVPGVIVPHLLPQVLKQTGSRVPNAQFNRGGPIFQPGIKLDASQVRDMRNVPRLRTKQEIDFIYHIYFNGPVYGDGPFLDDLSNKIAQRLRFATGR